jgi:hypothetical protein
MIRYQSQLDALIQAITEDVTQSVRSQLASALGGQTPRAGRATSTAARQSTAKAASQHAKGEKRSPALLEELTNTLGAYVRANPGQRIEEIAKGLELSTKDLVLPVKKLIGAKAIKPQGHRRATRYFPTVLRAKPLKAKPLPSAKAARVARKKPASGRKAAKSEAAAA